MSHVPGIREIRARRSQLRPSLAHNLGTGGNGDCRREDVRSGVDKENLAQAGVECCLESRRVVGRTVSCTAEVLGMHKRRGSLIFVLGSCTLKVVALAVQESRVPAVVSNLAALGKGASRRRAFVDWADDPLVYEARRSQKSCAGCIGDGHADS